MLIEDTKNKYEEISLNLEFKEEESKYNEEYKEELNEEDKKVPMMYPVGLVKGTYIVCQNEEGMYLIDQHAANERVNYEYYYYALNHSNDEIDMLIPLKLDNVTFGYKEILFKNLTFSLSSSIGILLTSTFLVP